MVNASMMKPCGLLSLRVALRSLVTSCRLLNATRSDNNPHGFIIEAFTITENKDLQTIKR